MNSFSYANWVSLKFIQICCLIFLFTTIDTSLAAIYEIPNDKITVIGEVSYTVSKYEDTLLDIARKHNLGFNEIKLVNPSVDSWIPGENQEIVLPNKYVLPVTAYEGIVLNIPEMRLYYFPDRKNGELRKVITHPLGIGREGWTTPYINTKIIQKIKNPDWYPPDSIRDEHAAEGRPLPKRVKSGPDNPLGAFAMRLGLPEYLIHGTNKPYGVGMRVSHGCIRLFPEDIQSLYEQVQVGTPVHVVNQPYKVGVVDGRIFLEAHPFLVEDTELFDGNLTSIVKMIVKMTGENKYDVDWELANQVISIRNGLPVEIGIINQVVDNKENNNMEPLIKNLLELKLDTVIRD